MLEGVRAGYDRWSEVYDHDGNPLVALEEPEVRRAARDVRGVDALDLGCGTGRHALWMAAAGARVTAVDFSDGMLAAARRKAGAAEIQFVAHDLNTPLPESLDGRFDLVVSGLVIEHLEDLAAFFGGVRRALRPGGSTIVSGMHPAMTLLGTQARFTDPVSGESVEPGSLAHTVSAVAMAAIGAGLAIEALVERCADRALATAFPRAEKYIGWPMLMMVVASKPRA